MGFTDSIKSSSSSTDKSQKEPNKYAKWYGEDWGMGKTKLDDRRAWGMGSGKYGMYKREDFGMKPKESKE